MREILVHLAKTLTFKQLTEMIKEGIDNYERSPTKENANHIGLVSLLIGIHLNTEGKSAEQIAREWNNGAELLRAFKSVQ